MSLALENIRALLIDLDGVLWVGSQALPGVAEFFAFLDAHKIHYVLVSNNATRRADYTVARVSKSGVTISTDNVLTSADAAPRWLKQKMPALRRVYMVGEPALREALIENGFELVEKGADAVIVGLDREITYAKLKRATLEIRGGAKFIATNTDSTLPTEEGLTPGAGSIIAALVAATDTEPLIIGKPGRPMFELALEITGSSLSETAMLGDRLDTDIDGAGDMGLQTIMVLTGVSTRAEAEQNRVKPDLIVDDLAALTRVWAERY